MNHDGTLPLNEINISEQGHIETGSAIEAQSQLSSSLAPQLELTTHQDDDLPEIAIQVRLFYIRIAM